MASKSSREGDKPVTQEEVLQAAKTLDSLVSNYLTQIGAQRNGTAFLSDKAFSKVQNLYKTMLNNPGLYTKVDRTKMQTQIEDYLTLQYFQKEIGNPMQKLNQAVIGIGQDLYSKSLKIYKKAKADLVTDIDEDTKLLRELTMDFGELFEKAAATRRKNEKAKKSKQNNGGNGEITKTSDS